MKHLCRIASCLVLAAAFTSTTAAFADTFTFQVTGNQITGSGTLTAIPDATTTGAFDITSISGTFNGATINGLLPCAAYSPAAPCTDGSLAFDNLLYPAGDPTFFGVPPYVLMQLDLAGLGFDLSTGQALDIGAANGHQYELSNSTQIGAGNPTYVSFTATQTPEPSTIFLFAAGLFGIAATARRRIRTQPSI